MSEINNVRNLWAIATDPVYIGTGGYTIGRVDNTIVRDPITKIPKIPGTSLAGTWRYYTVLHLHSLLKEDYRIDRSKRKEVENIEELFKQKGTKGWELFKGNRYVAIKCAGQDEAPTSEYIEGTYKDGHCGSCIVCKAFGYSKQRDSWQGMLFFSDLNILFFPVYTRRGVKWITSSKILQEAGLLAENSDAEMPPEDMVICHEQADKKMNGWINLGWLNLPYTVNTEVIEGINLSPLDPFKIQPKDIYVVPDSLVSQIINSNLEVRTSVSIDPLTGAAKKQALFTSEAIPRATVFYGNIRISDKSMFINKQSRLPSSSEITSALTASKHFYETMGIGGMTTRGFGRLRIEIQPGGDGDD